MKSKYESANTPRVRRRHQLGLAASLALIIAHAGHAQAVAPASQPAATTSEDEVLELSPFTVDASQDKGYRATSTLAGSRINTDLKDVAASITVVTKELMNDIGAVGINDILSYTANTEGTQDFTATKVTLGRPSDDASHNSNGANRFRGLFPAAITRDYFYTISDSVGFDAYNLDQVTINRGPNSTLAGLGLPGGIVNYSPVMPSLQRNASEVTLRYGSNNDQRATFNTNYVAKKGVFAVKVAGAWNDKGFKQQPAFNHDKRLHAAVAFSPFKKTQINASFERVKVDAMTPNTLTPEDQFTKWIAMGKPTSENDPQFRLSDTNFYGVVFDKNQASEGFRETSWGKMKSYEAWDWSFVNGAWVYGQSPLLYTNERLHDNSIVDLQNVNFMPSNWNQQLDATTITLNQEIVRNLNASVAFLHESYSSGSLDLFRPEYSVLRVDPNVKLADGSPNPHFQEIFMQFRGLDNKQADHNTNQVLRGALTYKLDLKKTNKWLGSHDFTVFGEDRSTEKIHEQWNATDAPNRNSEVSYIYYLGAKAGERVTNRPGVPSLTTGLNYYKDGVLQTAKKDLYYWKKSEAHAKEELRSYAAVITTHLVDDQVIGTIGIRRDEDKGYYASRTEGAGGDIGSDGILKPVAGYTAPAVEAETTHTYGVVVRPKILKYVSFHYNRAESWQPGAGHVELNGTSVSSPRGLGKDMGFSISALDDKLNVKFNWFDVVSKNGAADLANFPLAQWQLPFVDLTVMPDIAAAAGITNYKPGIAAGINTGDPRIFYTAENVSKGVEIEATYNVTRNWRVSASVSTQDSKSTNIAGNLSKFIEERLAYYKTIPGLLNGPISSQWGVNKNGQGFVDQFIVADYLKYKAYDGQAATQLAKYHANLITNYSWDEGALKGFNLGGGLRYIDKAIIGNGYTVDGSGNPVALDLNKAYYSPSRIAVDLWFGYTYKFASKRSLNLQVNIKNLEESGGFRAIGANSNGSVSSYSIIQPRTMYLTATYDF